MCQARNSRFVGRPSNARGNVVRHCEATPGMEVRNLDHIKEFLQQDTAVFPDSVQTVKLLVAEGDLVAAWTTYEGTQGPIGPFPPSGRKAQFDFGAVFRFEAGKIAEWWVTWDNMTILRQLGHSQVTEEYQEIDRGVACGLTKQRRWRSTSVSATNSRGGSGLCAAPPRRFG